MNRKWTRRLAFCLIITAFLCMLPAPAALEANPTLRIGLLYGSGALPGANLQNQTGSGYQFGYTKNSQFVPLMTTTETKVSTLKNKNVYSSNGTHTDASVSGAFLTGAYHMDTGVTYATIAEAQSAAQQLKSGGFAAFPVYNKGSFTVRTGSYASSAAASSAIAASGFSGTAATGSNQCLTVINTDTGEILFQFDGNDGEYFTITPLSANGKAITWCKGFRYYGSFMYRRMSGDNVTVINLVSMDDYVKGVIPYEMSPSWPLEALKAQAVCAKSYAVNNLNKHASAGFDLCTTTDCQVYMGTANATEHSDKAVNEVSGYYLLHNNQPANTFYHSSNGGSTEDSINVWSADLPYLKAVPDNFEDLTSATNGIWQFTYTNADFTAILKEKGYSTGAIVDAYIDQFTPAGNVYRLIFVDANGQKYNFEKEKARTILNSSTLNRYTYSQRYSLSSGTTLAIKGDGAAQTKSASNGLYVLSGSGTQALTAGFDSLRVRSASGVSALPSNNNTGTYTVSGRGWGHNVGLSQWGARGMATQGYTFIQILQYYFTDTTVSKIS